MTPLAYMLWMGWFRAVHAISDVSHERRTLFDARHQAVTMLAELDGQIRGMRKTTGLVPGTGNKDT